MNFEINEQNDEILKLIDPNMRSAFINEAIRKHAADNARWLDAIRNPPVVPEPRAYGVKPKL
jgi:hypothetical protein